MEYYIYTDGSYLPKYPNYSGWGYVILDSDENIVHSDYGKILCESRNIDGECHAVTSSLKYICKKLNSNTTIYVYYDYIGIQKWADGEWKTNKNVSIVYKSIIDNLKQNYTINLLWNKVKSHSGNKWNDYVDKLCKMGLDN